MILRQFEKEDIDRFKIWLERPHVKEWYADTDAWIEEATEHDTKYSFIKSYIAMEGDNAFGFCQYYKFVDGKETWNGSIPLEGTYSIDYMIGEEAYLHKRYGRKMVIELLGLVLTCNDMQRIIVQPDENNEASNGLLKSLGFMYSDEDNCYCIEREAIERIVEDNTGTFILPIMMCFGLSIGLAFGIIIDNMGLGICVGMCLGMFTGAIVDNRKRKRTNK